MILAGIILAPAHGSGAGLPEEHSKPNILFIIFTAWGGSTHAGAYGCTWIATPNFDRVAREGVLFKNAFTSNPKAGPSRATILTGCNTWQLREAVSHNGYFPAGFEVYPDLLEQAGYFVGMTGMGWGAGDFRTKAGRTRDPACPGFNAKTQVPIASGIARTDYAGNFEEFLRKRPKGSPFCFWMGFREAHRDFEQGSGLRLGKKLEDVKVPSYLPDLQIVRSDLLDYAVEIEWGDCEVGRALEVLEATGELDDTLVVVTSDRGMAFPYVKDQIHEDAFHVPMAMRWGRGISAGRVVDDFVNMRDLAPTFLELAGLVPHAQMTGASLAGILRSKRSGWIEQRDVMLIGKEGDSLGRPHNWGYPVRAIRTRDFLYVRNFFPDRYPVETTERDADRLDPAPTFEVVKRLGGYYHDIAFGKRPADELYRLSDDPEGMLNLANDPALVPTMERLRSKMMELLRDEEDPRALGNGAIFDSYRYLDRERDNRPRSYDDWIRSREPELKAAIGLRGISGGDAEAQGPDK